MSQSPARTRIDVGAAILANAWLARTWSAFLGTTVSLRHPEDVAECTARQAPDFQVEAGGRAWDGAALGGPSWSEEADPQGVTLQAEFEQDGLLVTSRAFAFHAAPALLRVLTVANHSGAPMDAGPFTLESLAFDAGTRGTPLTTGALVLSGGSRAWILAADAPALPQMDPGGARVAYAGVRTLPPGAQWHLPETALIACDDATPEAAQAAWGRFLLARRQLRAWREEAAAARADAARNN
jgi:hypothetical protein